MEGYRRSQHAVFSVKYHIIFVTKYRKPCINEEIGEYLKATLTGIIEQNRGYVHAIEYEKDHIHLLAELPLDIAVAKMVGVLKGVSSRNVRKNFSGYLSQFLWKDNFWSSSYFIASTGGVSMDVIKRYVENQRTEKSRAGRPVKR